MVIIIDNSKPGTIIFFTSKMDKYEFLAENEGSLLRSFNELLRLVKKTPSDVNGLAVKVGDGGFTATRLAVTMANTLAYALRIPVVAVKNTDYDSAVELIRKIPVGVYASAVYSAEPRIGKKVK